LPANTKRIGHLRDRPPVNTVTPEHLIAHLYQVTRVEKLMASEEFVLNRLGVRMEGSLVAKSASFGIIGLSRVRPSHICHYYYVHTSEICQVNSSRIIYFIL
jgi:hypothetical protein